ncbi:MAG: phage terminase large subunit, partial [Rhodospirillales bacterium]|nr:phage terminase large subunit [Rhodospirillales bacterium]
MSRAPSFAEFLWIWNGTQGQTTPRLHRDMARWLAEGMADGGARERLLLAFRDSGKSTVVGLFCAWLLLDDADRRILVLAAEQELARKMVRNVKRIIERHPLTRHLRPHSPDQWAADRFTVNRKSELRDPSMLARGIAANVT